MSFNPGTRFTDLTPEEVTSVIAKLSEPFDPEDIAWKPQNVKKDKATALAFAEPRVYSDRLNSVVGVANWTRSFDLSTTPFTKLIKGKAPWGSPEGTPVPPDVILAGTKLISVCTVTVMGVSHQSTGECDTSDENAATSSEAQSFKRACILFGLGRYLYDLPNFEAPYSYGKFTTKPTLPDWAIPKVFCEICDSQIKSIEHAGKTYSVAWLASNSKTKYGKQLCSDCQKEKAGKK